MEVYTMDIRTIFRPAFVAVIALMSLMILATACGSSADQEPKPSGLKSGGTLRVGMVSDSFDFDGPLMVNMPALAGLPHVYDNLVIRNADNTYRSMLAESWTFNADATQWTFKLREGVKFRHGKEFKAEDVIFSVNRLFEVESPLSTVMVKPKAMVAVDDHTIRFEFDEPNAVLIEALVKYHMVIMPSDIDPARFKLEEFGTGPFSITEHVVGERTIFKKNPDYFIKGRPYVDEMIFVYLDSPEARAESLKAGTIDVIFDLAIENSLSLNAHPDTTVIQAASAGYLNMAFDVTTAPFDNKLVRQAVQAVTDRQAILQAAQFGMGAIAYDVPVTENNPHFNADCKPPEYNVQLAKDLLAQAGYPDGITIELHTSTTGGGAMVPMATIMKEKAAPAGINIEIVNVPETGYWSDVWLVKPFVTVWWGGRPSYEAYSVVYKGGGSWNESSYANDEVDRLIDLVKTQAALADQQDSYGKMQCIIVEEVPRIIPVFRPVMLGARHYIKDLEPMQDFTFQARWAWMDK
jgi:peptide/nickel transport system substrate-binding protein